MIFHKGPRQCWTGFQHAIFIRVSGYLWKRRATNLSLPRNRACPACHGFRWWWWMDPTRAVTRHLFLLLDVHWCSLIRCLGKKCWPCGPLNMAFCHLLKTRTPQSLGQKKSPKWSSLFCFCCLDPVDDPLFVCSWWKNILKCILRMTYSEQIFCEIFTMFQKCYMTNYWRISVKKNHGGPPRIPRFQPSWYCSLGYKHYALEHVLQPSTIHPNLHFVMNKSLIGGDWNHGILNDFPYIGNVIITTDDVIFFRGVGFKPPTS